jgi:hypothetical protein
MKKRAQKLEPKILEEILRKQNIPDNKVKEITKLLTDAQTGTTTPTLPPEPDKPPEPLGQPPTYPGQVQPMRGLTGQMFGEPTPTRSPYDEPPALAEVADEEEDAPVDVHDDGASGDAYRPEEITDEFAKDLGTQIGIHWEDSLFSPEQLRKGLPWRLSTGAMTQRRMSPTIVQN